MVTRSPRLPHIGIYRYARIELYPLYDVMDGYISILLYTVYKNRGMRINDYYNVAGPPR